LKNKKKGVVFTTPTAAPPSKTAGHCAATSFHRPFSIGEEERILGERREHN